MNRFGCDCPSCGGSGSVKCNACKGVGSVWILPLDYKEWEPETWAREVCSRCRGDRVVECPRCSGRKGRLEARAA